MAARLRAAVEDLPGVQCTQPTESNGVFAILPDGVAERLREKFRFYDWDEAAREVRWMCSFDTPRPTLTPLWRRCGRNWH